MKTVRRVCDAVDENQDDDDRLKLQGFKSCIIDSAQIHRIRSRRVSWFKRKVLSRLSSPTPIRAFFAPKRFYSADPDSLGSGAVSKLHIEYQRELFQMSSEQASIAIKAYYKYKGEEQNLAHKGMKLELQRAYYEQEKVTQLAKPRGDGVDLR